MPGTLLKVLPWTPDIVVTPEVQRSTFNNKMASFKVSSVEKESKPLRKMDYEADLTNLLGGIKPEISQKINRDIY